jgi:hypothetical protein
VYDPDQLRRSAAADLRTTPDKIACRDEGSFADYKGETRYVSYCHIVGRDPTL